MKVSNVLLPLLQTTAQVTSDSPLAGVNTKAVHHQNSAIGLPQNLTLRETQGLEAVSWSKAEPYAKTYLCSSDDQCGPFGHCTTTPEPKNETLEFKTCECDEGYVNNPRPNDIVKSEDVCSYKQLEQKKQRTISWAAGYSGADYFTSARGGSVHILIGGFKAAPLFIGIAGGAVYGSLSHRANARSGMARGALVGGTLQAAWWIFDGIRNTISPNSSISFKDGRGVPFHA